MYLLLFYVLCMAFAFLIVHTFELFMKVKVVEIKRPRSVSIGRRVAYYKLLLMEIYQSLYQIAVKAWQTEPDRLRWVTVMRRNGHLSYHSQLSFPTSYI